MLSIPILKGFPSWRQTQWCVDRAQHGASFARNFQEFVIRQNGHGLRIQTAQNAHTSGTLG